MNTKAEIAQSIRGLLPRSYGAFFGKYGRFTDVQINTIPHVLAGHSVVVSAPTAMGKTEAVVAPLAEMSIVTQKSDLRVIYVVPTRALANDIFARLEEPLREIGITARIKHGDRSALPDFPPDWLITTPESLDSLLCRRTDWLQTVSALVLDEIHLLDNTYRGDQLRILVERVRRVRQGLPLVVHLLSATLPDPHALASRYVEEYQLVEVTGQREIEPYFAENNEAIWQLARSRKWKKLLYFCNTRAKVEETASQITERWRPYPVVAHHGSLERDRREEAEKVMKENDIAVCVATMTLEIGIDIGNIDAVVLVDPPWSVAALLQRVGRGSRRSNTIHAIALCSNEIERAHMAGMFDAASTNAYLANEYVPTVSVIVQQTLSLLYQGRPSVLKADIFDLLAPLASPIILQAILEHLESTGWLIRRERSFHPTTQLMDLAEKGEIHSNVPDSGDYAVIDSASGRTIGRVSGVIDSVFLLNGSAWRIIETRDSSLLVHRTASSDAAARFITRRNVGRFHPYLPFELRNSK